MASCGINMMNAHESSSKIPQPRLIPYVVSEYAKNEPHKIWAALPLSATDASEGYEDITFARLNYAVSRAADWLTEILTDIKLREFEALAYMGPPDSRYVILAIAAIKAGFQMLFLSPRNSDEAQYSVLEQANCQKFLCAAQMKKRVDALIQKRPKFCSTVQITVPEQDELLKDEFVSEYPYERTVENARKEPLVTLHTSSTTGMPKTIHLNQGYGLHEDVVRHVPAYNGLDIITRKPFYGQCRMFVAMPLFHAGGVLLTLLKSIYHDIVAIFQPPSVLLNAEVFDSILRFGKCSGCVLPPSLLEDMLGVPAYFDTLASLDFVQFGSGPLSKATGDMLLTRQRNCPHYIGSSECGLYLLLELDNPIQDWQYFRFHPWSGVEMRPINGDGNLWEMFVMRIPHEIPGMQPVFELFPDLDEWPTKDLYMQHPTRPDHWRSVGRNDDVLVLSNGEKLNPNETESRIANTHPTVSGALVVGQGRFMPGLLLEIRDTETTDPKVRAKLIEEIWPIVERANIEAPKHGQLTKFLILFTLPQKPFLRTPKLSVRRGPTVELYATEIADMYERFEQNFEAAGDIELARDLDMSSIDGIQDVVLSLTQELTAWDIVPGLDDELFALGLDSLHVTRMTRAIKQLLTRQTISAPQTAAIAQLVYGNPTVRSLSKALYKVSKLDAGLDLAEQDATKKQLMGQLIIKYTDFNFKKKLEIGQPAVKEIGGSKRLTIILTGSTGSLGSYLISKFLSNPSVVRIYCLNRSEEARKRQLDAMLTQGLAEPSDFDSRVRFLHTSSLEGPFLGLSDEGIYNSLLHSGATHIIHNAWPVNFNLSLSSFASHLGGVRALVDFCIVADQQPRLYFVSSLSSVTSLSLRHRVPETVIFDASAPSHMGYGESKYIAERILHEATVQSGGRIASTILRVGQIAGPVGMGDGVWPAREWLPSLVISSKCVGALPETLGRMEHVDWIPVDVLADIIDEMVTLEPTEHGIKYEDENSAQSKVYHLLNPASVSWNEELLPTVKTHAGVDLTLPLSDWIDQVRNGPDATENITQNPAKKILGFYEALVVPPGEAYERNGVNSPNGVSKTVTAGSERYETVKSAQRSKVFREMGPVTKEWMRMWTTRWFLS